MVSDWVDCKLGDVVNLKRGYDLPKRLRELGSIPLISSSGVSDYHSIAKVKGPGVVTGRYGTIGEVYFSRVDFWPLNTTLYVQDFKDNYPQFIYYFLKTISYNDYSDKAAVPGVNRNHLHLAEVKIPKDIAEQKAIAHILGTLDDKIELNRQMNETLEAMAQALFKSWFVDFDPVIDNALLAGKTIPEPLKQRAEMRQAQLDSGKAKANSKINDLFPSGFEFTEELGWIPKGWKIKCFGDVSLCFDKNRVPLSKKQREEKKPGYIPYHGATSVMDYINEWIFDDIYLLIGEDGSVIKEDGSPFVQYIWGKSWVNNHAHVLQGKDDVSTEHLMLFMQAQNLTPYITGAVQLKINQKNMNSIPFLYAGEALNKLFSETITPYYSKLRNSKEENEILAKLRDTLLPKLMSGELRIPDAEKLVEDI